LELIQKETRWPSQLSLRNGSSYFQAEWTNKYDILSSCYNKLAFLKDLTCRNLASKFFKNPPLEKKSKLFNNFDFIFKKVLLWKENKQASTSMLCETMSPRETTILLCACCGLIERTLIRPSRNTPFAKGVSPHRYN
jgi:hypothetical protein